MHQSHLPPSDSTRRAGHRSCLPPATRPSAPGSDSRPTTDHDVRASGFLAELMHSGVHVDAAAMQIGVRRWAIHATVVYGGEIIVAEFDALESAHLAVAQALDPGGAVSGGPAQPGSDLATP
jgi:hypothetical protein